jgi:predicted nucleic acid-binding protein
MPSSPSATTASDVRYWDASALAPLCMAEPSTATLRRLATEAIVTWAISAVEIASAIERRGHDGAVSGSERRAALDALASLSASWTEIAAIGPVRERAQRLLATHRLRAADALQLAAALVAVSDRTAGHEFVCLDARLRDAAAREGFRLLPDVGT